MDTILGATCDRCGPAVRAMYSVELANGGALTYCGSCTTQYRVNLTAQGASIHEIQRP